METLVTARLQCRIPQPTDATAIFKIYSDPRTSALSPISAHRSLIESEVLLEQWRKGWTQSKLGVWAIANRINPNEIVGFGGAVPRDFNGTVLPNLWFRFTPESWGAGLATEFASAIVVHVKRLRLAREVHALALPSNTASIRIIEKLGMKRRGTLNSGVTAEGSLWYYLSLSEA